MRSSFEYDQLTVPNAVVDGLSLTGRAKIIFSTCNQGRNVDLIEPFPNIPSFSVHPPYRWVEEGSVEVFRPGIEPADGTKSQDFLSLLVGWVLWSVGTSTTKLIVKDDRMTAICKGFKWFKDFMRRGPPVECQHQVYIYWTMARLWLLEASHLNSIASSGHCRTQAPQAMHFSGSWKTTTRAA